MGAPFMRCSYLWLYEYKNNFKFGFLWRKITLDCILQENKTNGIKNWYLLSNKSICNILSWCVFVHFNVLSNKIPKEWELFIPVIIRKFFRWRDYLKAPNKSKSKLTFQGVIEGTYWVLDHKKRGAVKVVPKKSACTKYTQNTATMTKNARIFPA